MRRAVLVCFLALSACVMHRPIERQPKPAPEERLEPVRRPAALPPKTAPSVWVAAGQSHQGRAIETRVVGRGPRRVLWVGGIHGTEREGRVATEELPAAFAAEPGLAEMVTLTLIRDVNPDGSAAGRRGNARGVDLNRNFPADNFSPSPDRGRYPLDQPESRLLHDLILTTRPHLVVVCHSTGKGYINYDGPGQRFAERFSAESGYPVVESDALHSTPGSLGSWLGIDLGVPILTLEYRRGIDPERAWAETRSAILAVLRDVAAGPESGSE